MAEAQIKTEVVATEHVELILTMEEAQALKHLTGSVPGHTRLRTLTSNAWKALQAAGIDNGDFWNTSVEIEVGRG